jgi:hypothetical protein
VQALFGRPFTAASFLLHVAVINLIAARSAYIDGECGWVGGERPHACASVCKLAATVCLRFHERPDAHACLV